jgi:hypothetical protein
LHTDGELAAGQETRRVTGENHEVGFGQGLDDTFRFKEVEDGADGPPPGGARSSEIGEV